MDVDGPENIKAKGNRMDADGPDKIKEIVSNCVGEVLKKQLEAALGAGLKRDLDAVVERLQKLEESVADDESSRSNHRY